MEASMPDDLHDLAPLAGKLHHEILLEIRRIRPLRHEEVVRESLTNLEKLTKLEIITPNDMIHLRAIFEASGAPELEERITSFRNYLERHEKNAATVAAAIQEIAWDSLQGARTNGLMGWRNVTEDLAGSAAGAVAGARIGAELGLSRILACSLLGAVGGGVAASL
jgi:hypothetical protein